MESRPESIQELFTKVQQQLNLTIQSQNTQAAKLALRKAEEVMGKIECLILKDPEVNEEHIRRVVAYTRGPVWQQARKRAASLN
ncbi:hypothetical protein FBR05_03315 [Deltaproteobacteria bacterium PRO3]|nr:hypothetical protein [Deltaproteobacteria bacterium PRO3]